MPEMRKVAAILVADIVGFSRLAGADEERTLARLRALRSDLIDPTIAVHSGRLVKRTGDGAVVEFRSVVEAVRAAMEVLGGLAERNAGVPAGQRIEVRIGIHLGDVVEEADGDLMGDGVNVAARLQAICKPGEICLSEDAYRQVRDRLQVTFADLGEQNLKNIVHPVRVYALRLGVAASASAVTEAQRFSVIVLPFANLSGDPGQDYFADGLTAELTTDLSHLPGSFVIGRSTAFSYKGKPVDLRQLGRELGVRYAVEGGVRRVGDAVTINVQLVSTETGAEIWAERFEGQRGKLGELQVETVMDIASALGVQLVSAEALRSLRERPTNPDVVDLLFRASATLNEGITASNVSKAIEYYDQALRLDPDEPWALLSRALLRMGLPLPSNSPAPEVLVDAERVADRVLATHPGSAFARYVKGVVAGHRGQFASELLEMRAAIAANRNYAPAYAEMGMAMVASGRAEDAIQPIEQALRLDPHSVIRYYWEYSICIAYESLGQWGEAAQWCEKSVASNTEYTNAYIALTAAYGWLGRSADAAHAVTEVLKRWPGATVDRVRAVLASPDPKVAMRRDRVIEGLRKAGLPEG